MSPKHRSTTRHGKRQLCMSCTRRSRHPRMKSEKWKTTTSTNSMQYGFPGCHQSIRQGMARGSYVCHAQEGLGTPEWSQKNGKQQHQQNSMQYCLPGCHQSIRQGMARGSHVCHAQEDLVTPEWNIIKKLDEKRKAEIQTKYAKTRAIAIKDRTRRGRRISSAIHSTQEWK